MGGVENPGEVWRWQQRRTTIPPQPNHHYALTGNPVLTTAIPPDNSFIRLDLETVITSKYATNLDQT